MGGRGSPGTCSAPKGELRRGLGGTASRELGETEGLAGKKCCEERSPLMSHDGDKESQSRDF